MTVPQKSSILPSKRREHGMIGKMTIDKMMIMAGTLAMTSAVTANTGTVTASIDGDAFNVSFAGHAHETNSLWVQRVVGTTVIFR